MEIQLPALRINPRRAAEQATNLWMLMHVGAFMESAHRICRVHDDHRKRVASERSRADRRAYLTKCYPNRRIK